MATVRVHKKRELKVVFDTNALYTDSERFLVSKEVSEFILANSAHPDLVVRWYLSDVALHERQYQMQQSGMRLLPSIAKLEGLIGVNFNANQGVVETAIKARIDEQATQLQLNVLELDETQVDWRRLILDAIYRRPPFSAEPSREKGFRDAIILEEFVQLVDGSPSTISICRLVLVTNDNGVNPSVRHLVNKWSVG